MVTEYLYECNACGSAEWYTEEDPEDGCRSCGYGDIVKKESVKRDESKGFCTVGIDGDDVVDCQLVATHRAKVEEYEGNGTNVRKICSRHAELWDGIKGVIEIWEV